MRHEYRLAVRSYECDVNGHVNNAIYLNYLEAARVEFLRAAGLSYRELRERGYGLMVVRLCIDFKDEARMDDPLIIATEPVKKRFTGGTFSQKVFREEAGGPRLIADAEVVWVCVDRDKKPAKLPPFLDMNALQPAGPAPG
jgi:YbgC/YbaW family acyl-CoA thioester hydrolase